MYIPIPTRHMITQKLLAKQNNQRKKQKYETKQENSQPWLTVKIGMKNVLIRNTEISNIVREYIFFIYT